AQPRSGLMDPTTVKRLLLERHDEKSLMATYLPIDLGLRPEEQIHALASFQLPAMPHSSWPGHYRSIVAFARDLARAVAIGSDSSRAFQLEIRRIADSSEAAVRTIDLGAIEPVALHMYRDKVFVGAAEQLGYVDLAAASPAYRELIRGAGLERKAYDLFARA